VGPAVTGSYAALSRNETILEAVTNTLAVGAAAVVLSLVIGLVMALHYCSGRSAGREIMQFVVFLPFLMPPMVTGLSLLVFFREIDFDRSLITITIGHTVFILTLAYRTIVLRLQSLDRASSRPPMISRQQRADLSYILCPLRAR
jgi:putative spermidine/putrescine transport system permease protein/spermidine/putrescine transport system permease protein